MTDGTAPPAAPAVASPCIQICSIDQATGWCHGCGRTVDEIMDWGGKPEAQRFAIAAALPARLAQLPKKERRQTRRRRRP